MEQQISLLPDGSKTFFHIDAFPWVASVEAQWQAVRHELDRVLLAMEVLPGFEEIQVEQTELTTDKRWKIFPLFVYGKWLNEKRCPATSHALRKIPELKAAMFSILEPNKELPPHRGPYSGVLRYHLGLKIPQPESQCGIDVGGDVRNWQEGASLIFDDSHEHSAWNRSSEERIVLFVDFARPLPDRLKATNELVLQAIAESEFIGKALKEWHKWEMQYGARIDELMST